MLVQKFRLMVGAFIQKVSPRNSLHCLNFLIIINIKFMILDNDYTIKIFSWQSFVDGKITFTNTALKKSELFPDTKMC